jgi:hypothetical protein
LLSATHPNTSYFESNRNGFRIGVQSTFKPIGIAMQHGTSTCAYCQQVGHEFKDYPFVDDNLK